MPKRKNNVTVAGPIGNRIANQVLAGQLGKDIGPSLVTGVVGGPHVYLYTTAPKLEVTARLYRPVEPPVPRPRIKVTARHGGASLTDHDGRDPFQVVLPLKFDGFAPEVKGDNRVGQGRRSVERLIEQLELMAMRSAGRQQSPIVKTIGPVPTPTGDSTPEWRIESFAPLLARTIFNAEGKRCRWYVDVTLIEVVRDRKLASSLNRTLSAKGIEPRTATVPDGVKTLHDFAKKVLGSSSRAKDVARANGFKLTAVLKPGQKLRLP